jgi:hypothetical protein
VFTLGLAACATAGSAADDVDAPVSVPVDACPDADNDGVCNGADKCAGFDDRIDTDLDTVADGCDKCAGEDDRIDANANMVPDCLETATRTVDLKAVNGNLWRGWHASNGGHLTDNDNTLTGEFSGATYNSYYVFALTGFVASKITSVTLEIQLEQYSSGDANETFSVWDVSAAGAAVEASGTNATIFNDLQSGVSYAVSTVTSAQVATILSIPLSAQAATDATAKVGNDFVVGIHLDSPPNYLRFGNTGASAPPNVVRVVVKYLP